MTPTLHSIAIFVHDIARAVTFYRDTLGLPLTKQGSFGAEFLEGETHLSVHPAVHKDARSLVGAHRNYPVRSRPASLLRRAARPWGPLYHRADPAVLGHHGDDRRPRWQRDGAVGRQAAGSPRACPRAPGADGSGRRYRLILVAGPEAIFDHLGLLLHAVRSERLAGLDLVAVRGPTDPNCSVNQVPCLGGEPPAEVLQRPPRLILAAGGQP